MRENTRFKNLFRIGLFDRFKGKKIDKPMIAHCVALSEQGKRRTNEDNYLHIIPNSNIVVANWLEQTLATQETVQDWDNNFARIALVDGMGGHRGGQVIAQKAIKLLVTSYPPTQSSQDLRDVVLSLHARLYDEFGDSEETSPGTTLIIADIHLPSATVVLASIGDSRAYLYSHNGLQQLTYDHTYQEFDWRDGELSDEDYNASLNMQTTVIAQALGYGSFGLLKENSGYRPNRYSVDIRLDLEEDPKEIFKKHVDVMQFTMKEGQVLYLASDGLWSGNTTPVWDKPTALLFPSLDDLKADIQSALNSGSKDNITMLAFTLTNHHM